IRRFLGHDSQTRFALGPFPGIGAMLVTEDRSNRLEIQPSSGAIDQTLKDGYQIPTTPEQEVPAVLGLIDRERVLAVHLLLFGHIQSQTETLGEPTPQDLLQAPYRAGLAQGICDPVQVCDIVPIGETVALLSRLLTDLHGER